MATTPGVNPDRTLPKDRQDICKHCGWPRTKHRGHNDKPRCDRQGCPGQHDS